MKRLYDYYVNLMIEHNEFIEKIQKSNIEKKDEMIDQAEFAFGVRLINQFLRKDENGLSLMDEIQRTIDAMVYDLMEREDYYEKHKEGYRKYSLEEWQETIKQYSTPNTPGKISETANTLVKDNPLDANKLYNTIMDVMKNPESYYKALELFQRNEELKKLADNESGLTAEQKEEWKRLNAELNSNGNLAYKFSLIKRNELIKKYIEKFKAFESFKEKYEISDEEIKVLDEIYKLERQISNIPIETSDKKDLREELNNKNYQLNDPKKRLYCSYKNEMEEALIALSHINKNVKEYRLKTKKIANSMLLHEYEKDAQEAIATLKEVHAELGYSLECLIQHHPELAEEFIKSEELYANLKQVIALEQKPALLEIKTTDPKNVKPALTKPVEMIKYKKYEMKGLTEEVYAKLTNGQKNIIDCLKNDFPDGMVPADCFDRRSLNALIGAGLIQESEETIERETVTLDYNTSAFYSKKIYIRVETDKTVAIMSKSLHRDIEVEKIQKKGLSPEMMEELLEGIQKTSQTKSTIQEQTIEISR